ncbi:kinase-like protein [Penicillium nucicola]|uniref:kinase-like protein n=1 Tax=Penicillium nucicola TaxID=1850975 RepID=UPI0025458789|nr:kinase-like protein [Penicillium nucicola]KAJ5746945.1 kinase-like protein [Penicillium nucicola]
MTRVRQSKYSKLPVRFTREYTCHATRESILGIKFEEKWKKERSLGQGAYGVVWLQQCVTDSSPGRLRAVKEIVKASSSDTFNYTRELKALAKFSRNQYADYFVRSSGWYENEHSIFIAMEYMRLGDLQQYLGKAIPEVEAQTITFQLLDALAFMHKDGYAHRDLKPANIFVSSKGPDWWIKIGDFGVSKRVDHDLTALRTAIGTLSYMAPEMLLNKHKTVPDTPNFVYTSAVDIWSVGVIAFYILTGELPFSGIPALLQYTMNPDDSLWVTLRDYGVSRTGEDLVKKLLCVVPADRLSVGQALRHRWWETIPPARAESLGRNSQYSTPESIEPSGRWSAFDETETWPDTQLEYRLKPSAEQVSIPSNPEKSRESHDVREHDQEVFSPTRPDPIPHTQLGDRLESASFNGSTSSLTVIASPLPAIQRKSVADIVHAVEKSAASGNFPGPSQTRLGYDTPPKTRNRRYSRGSYKTNTPKPQSTAMSIGAFLAATTMLLALRNSRQENAERGRRRTPAASTASGRKPKERRNRFERSLSQTRD